MSQVGEIEIKTQSRVIKLLQNNFDYKYLGNWLKRANNSNIEENILREYLIKQKYSETLINKALYELNKIAKDQSKSLYETNKSVYELLRYGIKVKEDIGQNSETIYLIDWKNPINNEFAIAEEVTIRSENTKRPDVVIYVNGIALAVLELKRSTISVAEGIRQNLLNQKKNFIQSFFNTIQLVMAGNNTEGLRYGVIETTEKYYLSWKEEAAINDESQNMLDRQLVQIFEKARFLELIHDFIVFDVGTKKICRHNQYFGIKAAQARVRKKEDGIIWHTQGSGKSLTMIWLAKWIRENITDARVLIITDREALDSQIEGIFLGVNENIHRCKSGKDLIEKLNQSTPPLLCSLIHKFSKKKESDYEGFLAAIERSLPKDFVAKGNLFVFIDECHRTQSGLLHQAMKKILPNAMFIGFTGTPLLKKDKQKSTEIFGRYIHTYKCDEGVKDGVILDLRYEARDIDQTIASPEKMDQWFIAKTKGLNNYALTRLKKKWGTMQRVLSSQSRLEKIVADILLDMETKDRLSSGRGNAMLVAGSIYQACKFYELFIKSGFLKCAIVTSYVPSKSDIRTEETGEGATEKLKQYKIYQNMLGGKNVEEFEEEVKRKFIKEPGQMKLLIVVDKLLTGFDAPPATYLYIDKKMQDHGLFQAICRVNRLDGVDKEFGYIIDYKGLFPKLEHSIQNYTAGALDGYDKEDVAGLLTDRLEKAKERLEECRESIMALCEPVNPPRDSLAYIHYFCGSDTSNKDKLKDNEQKRIALYKQASALLRAFANIANEYDKTGYTHQEFTLIKREVEHYKNVCTEIKLASGDYIDLKVYEPAMRHLIDTYIHAEESVKISAFDDLSLVQLIIERGADAIKDLPDGIKENKEAVAETVENNLRKVITDEQQTNPKYYEHMSKLLDDLIKERKEGAFAHKIYLAKIAELSKQVKSPSTSAEYPSSMDTAAKRALYDNLGKDEKLAENLNYEIINTKKDGWRDNKIKEREVFYAISKYVKEDKVEDIFEIVKNQKDY